jgi:hypothetical protein
VEGQIKIVTMISYGGDVDVSGVFAGPYTFFKLAGVGNSVILMYAGSKWNPISNVGAVVFS